MVATRGWGKKETGIVVYWDSFKFAKCKGPGDLLPNRVNAFNATNCALKMAKMVDFMVCVFYRTPKKIIKTCSLLNGLKQFK